MLLNKKENNTLVEKYQNRPWSMQLWHCVFEIRCCSCAVEWNMSVNIHFMMNYPPYHYIVVVWHISVKKMEVKEMILLRGAFVARWPRHVLPVLRQVPGLLLWDVWLLHALCPPGSDPQQPPQRRGPQGQRTGSANQLQGTDPGTQHKVWLTISLDI